MNDKTFCVFYVKGARIGSLIKGNKECDEFIKSHCMHLIQTDASGTEHYEVLSR